MELTTNTRPAAVAGLFYPDNVSQLKLMLDDMLDDVTSPAPPPKAMIVPHAGYIYSGPIAASAYASLKYVRDQIKQIILLGPSHRLAFNGMALSSAQYFVTPLGKIPLDTALIETLSTLPDTQILDQAHQQEHSLEVQLPFLQAVLNDFTLVPIVVGHCPTPSLAKVLEACWGNEQTLIVISSDLSHYHDYDTAKKLDSETSEAIMQLRYDDIHPDMACGSYPVNGLLSIAQRHHLQAACIDVRNSGDTAGDHQHVVGYGSYFFYEDSN